MSLQHGRGEGVSGILDMIVDGITHSAYSFGVRVYGWDWEVALPKINRTGRQGRPKWRLGDFSGEVSLEGQVQTGQWPFPANAKYATGSLTLTQDLGTNTTGTFLCGISFPVRLPGWSMATHDKRSKDGSPDLWDYKLTAIIDGPIASMNWNGTQVTFTAATLNFCETDVGLSKIIDPNSLTSHATQRIDAEGVADNDTSEVATLLAYIAGATPPFALAQVNTAHWVRTDSAGGHFILDWRLKDTTEDILFPVTSSYGSTQRPYTDTFGALINTGTNNMAQSRNILWNSCQNQPYIVGVRVDPIVPGISRAVFSYVNPGVLVRYKSTDDLRVTSRTDTSNGHIQVYVIENRAVGSGYRLVTISASDNIDVGREIIDFTITRHGTGLVIPRQYPNTINGVSMPYFWNTNDATFLGNASGSTVYTNTSGTINAANGTNNTALLATWYFHSDSNGIVLGGKNITLNKPIPCNGTSNGVGWVDVLGLGSPFTLLYKPGQASFSAFTS